MKEIFLLGSLNADLTIRAPYLPEAGETLAGSDFMVTAGGKGANQAYAAANLGGRVHMAGAVGRDSFGDMLVESLKTAGADTRYVRRLGGSTGVAVIVVAEGDNRIVLDAGANAKVTNEDADALLQGARAGDFFIVQLESPLSVVGYALRRAKEKGLYTVLNPAPANAEAAKFLPYTDLVTPNRKELRLMSGKEATDAGCETLLRLGAGAVLVTLGGEGSYLYTARQKQKFEAVTAGETVDTTGAGDTFCGGLLVKLAEGASMQDAVRFASAAAGIAVTRRGAQVSIPNRSEVDKLLSRI